MQEAGKMTGSQCVGGKDREEEEQVSKDAEGSLQEGLLPTKDWPLSFLTIDAGFRRSLIK